MKRFMSRHKMKLFFWGMLLGLPVVLSFSGHFFDFWLRTVKVKILILTTLTPFMGLLIGFLLSLLKISRRTSVALGLSQSLLLMFFVSGVIPKYFERFPFPAGAFPTYTLSVIAEGGKNVRTSAEHIKLIRVMVQYPKRDEVALIRKRECMSEWAQLNDGSYFIDDSPGAEHRCVFSTNPGAEVKLVFETSPESGQVQVVFQAENSLIIDRVSYNLHSSSTTRKTLHLLAPESNLTLLVKFLDILSSIILVELVAVIVIVTVLYTSNSSQTFFLLPMMLLGIGSLIYLVLFPVISGYTIAKDRYDFQFAEWPQFEHMVRDVNRYVPEDASLVIIYPGKYPVSPLFGPEYARRLLPQYPAPATVSADYLRGLQADYLLMDAELFEKDRLGYDGQLHFLIYGGGEVLYPYYSLDGMLNSGFEIIASCVDKMFCQTRYYLFELLK